MTACTNMRDSKVKANSTVDAEAILTADANDMRNALLRCGPTSHVNFYAWVSEMMEFLDQEMQRNSTAYRTATEQRLKLESLLKACDEFLEAFTGLDAFAAPKDQKVANDLLNLKVQKAANARVVLEDQKAGNNNAWAGESGDQKIYKLIDQANDQIEKKLGKKIDELMGYVPKSDSPTNELVHAAAYRIGFTNELIGDEDKYYARRVCDQVGKLRSQ